MEHGKNSRQTVESKWLCMFTDYIEQCRRFSSLTSMIFCICWLCSRHTKNISRVYRQRQQQHQHNSRASLLFAQWACECESNGIHSHFWQIHNNWNQDHHRRRCTAAIIAISVDLCAFFTFFFTSFVYRIFFLFAHNIYWWWLWRGNGKCAVVTMAAVVVMVVVGRAE